MKSPDVEHTSSGLRIELPRVGFKAGHGTFWVGLTFLCGVSFFAGIFLFAVIAHGSAAKAGIERAWVPFVVCGAFFVASLLITVAGLRMALHTAVLEVSEGELRIYHKGILQTRAHVINRSDIAAIQSGPSGISIGPTKRAVRRRMSAKSVRQLHVYLKSGTRLRLLTGRTSEELDWLAEQLRNAIGTGTVAYRGD